MTTVREKTNAQHVPCYPVANGHGVYDALRRCPGGRHLVSRRRGKRDLTVGHLYAIYVPDQEYRQFAQGRTPFTPGSFTGNVETIADDRSSSVESGRTYIGARLLLRLEALGLPTPSSYGG